MYIDVKCSGDGTKKQKWTLLGTQEKLVKQV